MYNDYFNSRSRYIELVQILFIAKSILKCEPRSKAIIDFLTLQSMNHYTEIDDTSVMKIIMKKEVFEYV